MLENHVRLEVEAESASALFQRVQEIYLPLSVAAAITFHEVHRNAKAIVSQSDYDDALSIAAAALSRLICIYTLRERRQGRVAVTVDLTKAHFVRGATQLHGAEETIGELWVSRRELVSALSLIKRTGLPFSFAGKYAL
jgi:hypothetical protein